VKRKTYASTLYALRFTLYTLELLYLDNRQLHLAGGRLHRHLLVLALTQHGRAERRLIRDLTLAGFGLGAADDRPSLLLVLAVDPPRPLGANPNFVALTVLFVDDLGARENALDLADAPFQVRLLILGILVLAALGNVAQLFRGADTFGNHLAAVG